MKRKYLLTVAAGLLLTATLAHACQVPVFRYALEKWNPGAYQVIIFHDGNLTAEHKKAIDELKQTSLDGKKTAANYFVQVVNIEGKPTPPMQKLYEVISKNRRPALPTMVVHYPPVSQLPAPSWTGPLNQKAAQALLYSRTRRNATSELIKGNTAVWILLESGNKSADDEAEILLKRQLALFAAKRNLPQDLPYIFSRMVGQRTTHWNGSPLFMLGSLAPNDNYKNVSDLIDKLNGPVLPLQIRFSILRLARNDPKEAVFIRMLLNSEPPLPGEKSLAELKEPMAFPIFGRGRALYALVGKGINEDTIGEACTFLTGPCTCTVKDQNPGVDLLMAANWDAVLGDRLVKDKELPPLIGIGGFKLPKIQDIDPPEPKKETPKNKLPISPNQSKSADVSPTVLAKLTRQSSPWLKMMAELQKLSASDPTGKSASAAGKGANAKNQQASTDPSTVPVPKMPNANGTVGDFSSNNKNTETSKPSPPAATNPGLLRNTLIALVAGIALVAAVYLLARRSSGA